jgi:hypothetical protein
MFDPTTSKTRCGNARQVGHENCLTTTPLWGVGVWRGREGPEKARCGNTRYLRVYSVLHLPPKPKAAFVRPQNDRQPSSAADWVAGNPVRSSPDRYLARGVAEASDGVSFGVEGAGHSRPFTLLAHLACAPKG